MVGKLDVQGFDIREANRKAELADQARKDAKPRPKRKRKPRAKQRTKKAKANG